MTPSNNQQGEAKGFCLNDDDDSPHGHTASTLRAGADHSTRIRDTEPTTETESESETDKSGGSNVDPDADDDKALLAKTCDGTVVYHAIAPADNDDDTDATLCNKVGSYRRVPVTQARQEGDRYCRACAAQQKGTDRRPCPNCDRLIGVTYWPQHVRQCNGTPTHPNRPQATDSNSDSDADTDAGEKQS